MYDKAMVEHSDEKYKLAQKQLKKKKTEKDAAEYINPELADAHKKKGNELF